MWCLNKSPEFLKWRAPDGSSINAKSLPDKWRWHTTLRGCQQAKVPLRSRFSSTDLGTIAVATMRSRPFREQNIAVLRFDYRGHGRSSGAAVMLPIQDVRDLNAARECLERQNDGGLPICYGPAMVGLSQPMPWQGTRAGSWFDYEFPFFGFAIKVPLWKTAAGMLMSRYMPAFSMPTDIDPRSVATSPQSYRGMGPTHQTSGYKSMVTETKSTRQLPTLAPQLNMPILL